MEALGVAPVNNAVVVDRRLATLWFGLSIKPMGWKLPPAWDPIAGDYETADGWIKLHTNLPVHRDAACGIIGTPPERTAVAGAVAAWKKDDLEDAIMKAGGVAAAMRTRDEWAGHPQGIAVANEPLIRWDGDRKISLRTYPATKERPLAGLRVLDLTRVLAGPSCTRTLAGLGADVLRIDPPGWAEDNVEPEITLGKKCATLDLKEKNDRRVFEDLLSTADVLVHGYRPGALDGLGLDEKTRRDIAPNAIEVTLNAYGWSGPWARRRGFDSLVQMVSGLAASGMHWAKAQKPVPTPLPALDYGVGYLMAACVIKSICNAARGKPIQNAYLSLARMAEHLAQFELESVRTPIKEPSDDDFALELEETPWGHAYRLQSPFSIGETHLKWSRPACRFGSSPPQWPSGISQSAVN